MVHSPTHATCQTFRFMIWEWCVTRAQELIDGDPYAAELVPDGVITTLDKFLPLEPPAPGTMRLIQINVDPVYAMSTDLDKPIIVAPIAGEGNGVIVIDGWHRIYRARREGRESLPTYLLGSEAERECRIPLF